MLNGRTAVVTQTFNLADSGEPTVQKSEEKNALSDRDLVRPLLSKYELADIDIAIRWLQLGEYIGRTEWGLRGLWVHVLTARGVTVATTGRFSDDERKLFYLANPHQAFFAHQFSDNDLALERAVRDGLTKTGFSVVDGKVDGLEPFRQTILQKIVTSRFFLCLLTRRAELKAGGFASSVWLYQEIGAAVAAGKTPLLLVESGMDPHYAGELQKTYEYILFSREAFEEVIPEVIRRFSVDLERYAIPSPHTLDRSAV
jgi:hypothetical protein